MKVKYHKEFLNLLQEYPDQISKHLDELFSELLSLLDLENIVSIILLGSASRNELSFSFSSENKIDLHSDYEFVIITKRKIQKNIVDEVNNLIDNLESKWQIRSPLFCIDYGISTLQKFKHTPTTFWSFEVKSLGKIVYGEDAKKFLKDVNIENLDRGNLNELIIIRLWHMFIHMNNAYIEGGSSEYERRVINYYYARNILEIPTILLPRKELLIAGYRDRIKKLQSIDIQSWADFDEIFKEALKIKLNKSSEVNEKKLRQYFIKGYLRLLDIQSIEKFNPEHLRKHLKGFFKESFIRSMRTKYTHLVLFKNYYKFNIFSLKIFFYNNLRIYLILILVYLHYSIIEEDMNLKIEYLKEAFSYLRDISLRNLEYDKTVCYSNNVNILRENLIEFMFIWLYKRSMVDKSDLMEMYSWSEN